MNCHLATSFMPRLEQLVEALSPEIVTEIVHNDFRLWLTSMPCAEFPVAVLQNGIKLTTEPPKGVRANLKRNLAEIPDEVWEGSQKPRLWKKLLYALAFFHALVQERRKFGPLGWNIRYEFNESDFSCSKMVLDMFIREHKDMPWEALLYVTGEINYGGRVTDDLDRRCLLAILSRCLHPKAVNHDDFKLAQSGGYTLPGIESTIEEVTVQIQNLPATEEPEVFGMHANANINFQLQESSRMMDTVLSLQPRLADMGGGPRQEQVVEELAVDMLDKLPANLDPETALGSNALAKTASGQMNSLGTVVLHEVERFNKLLDKVRSSLKELGQAIVGTVVMSATLETVFYSLLNQRVPDLWAGVGYPSLKPLGSWLLDLIARVAFIENWLLKGTPKCFWLPGLFFPQGFMTGVLQTHARRHRIPIDTLSFSFKIQVMETAREVAAAPRDGVFVDGLFLEAARWDTRRRKLQPPNPGEMFKQLPVIHFIPTQNKDANTEDYQCPLYKTTQRAGVLSTTGASTNFILKVDIPSREPPEFWILQGTALVCQLND